MDPFSFSVLIHVESFFMFDKSVEFFGYREFFIRGVFIFGRDQVFHIVPVSFSTQPLNKVF